MEEKEEEKVVIRHSINSDEVFTLAKDVYDVRTLLFNIYNNRALIGRRLNLLTMTCSLFFTLLYITYIFFTGLLKKLSFASSIAMYCLLGVYVLLFTVLIILTVCEIGAKAKNIQKYSKILAFFRLAIRLASIAITAVAIVLATGKEEYAAKYVAVDIVLIVFSLLCMVIQVIPLLCGGFGRLARWLLSPVKIKCRFSKVALEWYELTVTSGSESKAVKKVAKKYYSEIGICLDNFLIPAFGKKYINSIKPAQILSVVSLATPEDKPLVEGICKNVFKYANECGYVTFDPCQDLKFEGSIDIEDKVKTVKTKVMDLGKKVGISVGMSLFKKFYKPKTDDDE